MLPPFILAKSICTYDDIVKEDYVLLTSNDIEPTPKTIIKSKNGLILVMLNQILWIKKITLEDFSTIEFVQDYFFDDYYYCKKVKKQYFYNKAKNITPLFS
ncbi:MAG: hypothetical protein LBL60_03160 [Mycoplasmataceae bacterium]|jgi:hypothetical protein|nr:hypothetical protein [Mycoplasmataceae bacterium]